MKSFALSLEHSCENCVLLGKNANHQNIQKGFFRRCQVLGLMAIADQSDIWWGSDANTFEQRIGNIE